MALGDETIKVLGQVAPTAVTNTVLYATPTTKPTVVSTITACNQTTSPVAVRIAVCQAAGTNPAAKEYLVYDSQVGANSTLALTWGLTLAGGDNVVVYTAASGVSFNVFGQQVATS